MTKQQFKHTYSLARQAMQGMRSCDFKDFHVANKCLVARGSEQYIDLYNKNLLGKYKREVIPPKGFLP